MSNTETKSGYVNFVVTGEYYENLIKDSFKSGEFRTVELLCNDAGLSEELIKKVFKFQFSMSGASNEPDDIQIQFLDESPEDFGEDVLTGIRSAITSIVVEDYGLLEILTGQVPLSRIKGGNNISVLLRYLTVEEISSICRKEILEHYGFKEYDSLDLAVFDSGRTTDGVILPSGKFIACSYQEHRELFPVLNMMGIVGTSDAYSGESEADKTVHISSNCISSGAYSYAIERGDGEGYNIPNEIYRSIWECDAVSRFYVGRNDFPVNAQLIDSYSDKQQNGKKYGNLMFLKEIAHDLFNDKIKLVNFSTDFADIKTNEVFIRTSPKYSIAGLLNSVKVTKVAIQSGHAKIAEEFEKFKDVVKYNEIHSFYQDYIEGKNGVANMEYLNLEGKNLDIKHLGVDFKYMVSSNQGDVVAGKITKEYVDPFLIFELEKFMKKIVKKVRSKIQVEFVYNEEKEEIVIVQLRIFKKSSALKNRSSIPDDVIMVGRTFNSVKQPLSESYQIEVDVDKVLIVDSEAKSEDLIGKDALIVMQDVDFSHILALSTALRIPSIFGISATKDDINKYKTVYFDTRYLEGVVTAGKLK